MYNRSYEYFIEINLLHKIQFSFQINNSAKHVMLHFTRFIAQIFNYGKFTPGVLIYFSKVFDTVDYQILLEKVNT